MKEKLMDRMIRIYGFENPIVIEFCKLCERNEVSYEFLEALVKAHEESPRLIEEEEEE